MKKTVLLFLLIFNILALIAQNNSKRLIIRADDMGSSHAANLACIESYKNGIVTSVEVMAVAPWFPEAVKLLNQNKGLDVGLHLVLTSEWENIKWRPLTDCPSLCDANGNFRPMVWPNENYPNRSHKENKWVLDEIETEFRAQIELALKNIPHLSHISDHMGCVGFDKEIAAMNRRLADEYNLTDLTTNPDSKYNFIGGWWQGPHSTDEEKYATFLKMLDSIKPGETMLFVEHPAYDNEEMRGQWHIGYENVANDRQGVTDLFTDKKIKQAIKDKGIELISYKELK